MIGGVAATSAVSYRWDKGSWYGGNQDREINVAARASEWTDS